MATRREVSQRKTALKSSLRESYRSGELANGDPAPPVRQLAEEYALSKDVAALALRELAEEGLFHSVPRVGVFAGRPQSPATEFYLMTCPENLNLEEEQSPPRGLGMAQIGFEKRISHLGGACLTMPFSLVLELRKRGELPPLCGIFEIVHVDDEELLTRDGRKIPRVRFYYHGSQQPEWDSVSYDDVGGGKQATNHLIHMGHRNIAYLGLHPRIGESGHLIWSVERECGWREALQAYGLNTENLSFAPEQLPNLHGINHVEMGRELATEILKRHDITAVVAANDFAAQGLLQKAQSSGIDKKSWPSIVGFDDILTKNGHIVSSMRLPEEEIGRAAADLLWDRYHGKLTGEFQHRHVPMRLAPRLTSRKNWSQNAEFTALTLTSSRADASVTTRAE